MRTKEFVLWNNCSMNCDFCNLHDKHQSSKEEQIEALKSINSYLDEQTGLYRVLFIGGEIFNGLDSDIENLLYQLYKRVILNPDIRTIYFNTNLLYRIEKEGLLNSVLTFAKENNRLKDIHFTTSDDCVGRWKNEKQKELFYSNIKFLRDNYSDMPVIVNTIMTKNLIHSDYNIKEYMDTYDTKVNFLPYININSRPDFLPTKHEYAEFIIKQKEYFPEYIESWIDLWMHDREVEVRQYNADTKILENLTETEKPCGKHNANFSNCFADSTDCFLCFLENFK